MAGATLLLLGITIGDMSKYKDNEELSVLILLFFTNITFICLLFYLVRYKYTTRDIMAYQEGIISQVYEHGPVEGTQDHEHGSKDRASQDEEHGSEDSATQLTQNNDHQLSVSTLRNEQLVQI